MSDEHDDAPAAETAADQPSDAPAAEAAADQPDGAPAAEADTEQPAEVPAGASPAGIGRRPRTLRTVGGVVVRGAVVLGAATFGYLQVVPVHHAVPARMSRLVITSSGVHGLPAKAAASGSQSIAGTGLTALKAAAAASPARTGLYSIEWAAKAPKQDVAGVIVFVLPGRSEATKVLSQVKSQQLSAKAFTTEGLKRSSTFTLAGVAGSTGSFYQPTAKASTASPDVAVAVYRVGNVVAVGEAVTTSATLADTKTVAEAEYHHLVTVQPGFDLEAVDYPLAATIAWGVGSVLVAFGAAAGPVLVRRRRRRRRQRKQEELDRLVMVSGQTVARRRRMAAG